MGDRGRQLAHRRDAVGVRELQLRRAVSLLVFASFCLHPFALAQIKHEGDTLVTALFKCCPTNQYGHAATVLSGEFLFERFESAATFLLFDSCVIPVAPVGRRQVCPPYAARNQVFAVVAHHAKKFVVGLENATVEIPDENSDDVGIDQAPDFRFAFPQSFLGALAFCYVCRSADELDELAVFIENQMTRGIDVPNCSVWQKNSVLGKGINSFAKRLLKSLFYPIAILGVDLLPKIVSRR